LGKVISDNKVELEIPKSFLTTASVLYDAVYVPGGANSVAALVAEPEAINFLNEAYKHCKAIAADLDARKVLEATNFSSELAVATGVVVNSKAKDLATEFIGAIAMHRFWEREKS
jgi:catalase